MESYEVVYSDIVVALDIPSLDYFFCKRIKSAIHDKLTRSPDLFGKPLHKPHKGLWSLGVGNYRVVYRIKGHLVRVIIIDVRSRVYRELSKRIKQEL